MRWNRLAAAAGITYVVLAFAEFFGPSFPKTGDSARALDAYFVDHRTWSLAAVVLQEVSNAAWVVFLCGLALLLHARRRTPAAAVLLAGGALNVAISLTGLACIAAIAFGVAGTGSPSETKAFFELASMTLVISNVWLALMAAAAAAARLERWFTWASAAAAIVFLAGSAAFARHGALSPDGAVQIATYVLELLWTVAAGIVLFRAQLETGKPSTEDVRSPGVPRPRAAVEH